MNDANVSSPTIPVVSLHEVSKVYDGQHALNGVSLDVQRGEFLTILGPSGCGKTTILRLIAGFEKVTSGRVYIDGQDVSGLLPSDVTSTQYSRVMPCSRT